MTQITISKMTVSDIPEVAAIERESFSTPWTEASFFSEINSPASICRVALSGDSLIGYICASCILDEGHILNLAVRPDYRRKGIGRRLVLSVLKELRTCGCKKIFLEVRASNTDAIKLYESAGFRMLGLMRGYYFLPKEDAVIMGLQLH
ncbi:Ribosomal-protein-S18p-alanine acetyltransferase [hydrothermal vent metagenome]|uniref:Ribosomal-protein-S18p-alanine acetyltransferase n=1 Tax=hydrothermal vent metagenome TaxID=652676 RepID=A0A3B1CS76_9ZZZZ